MTYFLIYGWNLPGSTSILAECHQRYLSNKLINQSPNHVQSGRSPGLNFWKKCTNPWLPGICKNIFKKVSQKIQNFRLKIGYNSGCNIKYTGLLKVEYLLNGSTDLYEILNLSLWDSYWLTKKNSERSVHMHAHA